MTKQPLTHLGDLPIEDFFEQYWQKKPLFIPGAFSSVETLDPNDLAGFALEEEVESRLIIETPKADNPFASSWQVQHGPLPENAFDQLTESHWTLLVQAVDQLSPEINALLDQFRFVPNWRLDDVMVSYAAPQGGVGPHFDYYDVFLVQALGAREWRIGEYCDDTTPLLAGADLKILTAFSEQARYLAKPGDLLYIPPNIAHWGVAQDACMTYSVGFRAPSKAELIEEFAHHLTTIMTNDHRFSDTERVPQANPGAISNADIHRVKVILAEAMADETELKRWFASYMTEPKRHSACFERAELTLTPDTRAAYVESGAGTAELFINGESFRTSVSLAERLCAYLPCELSKLTHDEQAVISQLTELGWFQ